MTADLLSREDIESLMPAAHLPDDASSLTLPYTAGTARRVLATALAYHNLKHRLSAPTDDAVERVGLALRKECEAIFGSSWNNQISWSLARAALAAAITQEQGGD